MPNLFCMHHVEGYFLGNNTIDMKNFTPFRLYQLILKDWSEDRAVQKQIAGKCKVSVSSIEKLLKWGRDFEQLPEDQKEGQMYDPRYSTIKNIMDAYGRYLADHPTEKD